MQILAWFGFFTDYFLNVFLYYYYLGKLLSLHRNIITICEQFKYDTKDWWPMTKNYEVQKWGLLIDLLSNFISECSVLVWENIKVLSRFNLNLCTFWTLPLYVCLYINLMRAWFFRTYWSPKLLGHAHLSNIEWWIYLTARQTL